MIGINIGSGKWACKNWVGIDKIYGSCLNQNSVLKFQDHSLKYAYSSHFFEHIQDNTILLKIDQH